MTCMLRDTRDRGEYTATLASSAEYYTLIAPRVSRASSLYRSNLFFDGTAAQGATDGDYLLSGGSLSVFSNRRWHPLAELKERSALEVAAEHRVKVTGVRALMVYGVIGVRFDMIATVFAAGERSPPKSKHVQTPYLTIGQPGPWPAPNKRAALRPPIDLDGNL